MQEALIRAAQPSLTALFRGRLRGLSIERLLTMLTAFGRDVEVVVRPATKAGKKGGMRFRREAA